MARREVVNKKKIDPLEEFDAPSETPDISKSVDIAPTSSSTLKKPKKLRRKLRRAKSAMSSSSKQKQQHHQQNKQHYVDSKAVSRP